MKDLVPHEKCVESHCGHLHDNQFAAMVSFAFNLGCGPVQKVCKSHSPKAIAGQIMHYTHAGGKVLKGLVNRRKAEKALFCKGGGC